MSTSAPDDSRPESCPGGCDRDTPAVAVTIATFEELSATCRRLAMEDTDAERRATWTAFAAEFARRAAARRLSEIDGGAASGPPGSSLGA